VTKAEPLSYADLHSHLLTHEFLHKSSLPSLAANPPLLPTPSSLPSPHLAQQQTSSNFGRNRGRSRDGWHSNINRYNNHDRSDFSWLSFLCPHGLEAESLPAAQTACCWWTVASSPIFWAARQVLARLLLCPHNTVMCSVSQQWSPALYPSCCWSDFRPTWFPNTGANQHVTPDLATLTDSAPNLSNNYLHVGDGIGLSIFQIGHTILCSPKRTFTLSNVLHVPHITKPLLSVQKFCRDNNIYFEFHASVFYVKDLTSKAVLLMKCMATSYNHI